MPPVIPSGPGKQVIEIVATMIDNVTGKTQEIRKSVEELRGGWERTTQTVDKFNKGLRVGSQTTTNYTKNLRRFKFEWLSVMFAGMALSRVFGGLIRAQFQLFGITDLLSSMWTLILLPVMMLLLPVILKLTEFFMNLPEGVRLAIGIFILLVAVIGTIAFVVGTVMLALGGLAIIFGITMGAAALAVGAVIAIIAAVAIVIALVVMAIKNNWFGLGDFVKKVWTGVTNFISSALIAIGNFFKTWFWEKPKEFLNNLWDFVRGIFSKIGSLVSGSIFGKAFKVVGGLLGSFQTGGVVPQTGPYILHRGETVVPENRSMGGMMNVTINASVSSDYDVRRIADQLKRYWVEDFERLAQTRGVS